MIVKKQNLLCQCGTKSQHPKADSECDTKFLKILIHSESNCVITIDYSWSKVIADLSD